VPVWLRLLALLLIGWEPLSLALEAAPILPTLGDRGVLVFVALALRVAVAAVGVAAGLALWNRRPHGVGLARVALALSGACQLASLLTRILPTNLPPDRRALAAVAIVLYYGTWIVLLSRSRVRSAF
jgi:hypothetical protein